MSGDRGLTRKFKTTRWWHRDATPIAAATYAERQARSREQSPALTARRRRQSLAVKISTLMRLEITSFCSPANAKIFSCFVNFELCLQEKQVVILTHSHLYKRNILRLNNTWIERSRKYRKFVSQVGSVNTVIRNKKYVRNSLQLSWISAIRHAEVKAKQNAYVRLVTSSGLNVMLMGNEWSFNSRYFSWYVLQFRSTIYARSKTPSCIKTHWTICVRVLLLIPSFARGFARGGAQLSCNLWHRGDSRRNNVLF